MRELPSQELIRHNPTSSPPPSSSYSCDDDGHACRWRPYSNSKDFEANAAMIFIILLCALVCAITFNAAIRCLINRSRRRTPSLPISSQNGDPPTKQADAAATVETPELEYSAGMKLAAGEAECAICLSDFVNGDKIRVLGGCNHGFHAPCIHRWLSSHSSCPTCRATCIGQ